MARGKDDFADAVADEKISISNYPLSASVACGKVKFPMSLFLSCTDRHTVLLCSRRSLGHFVIVISNIFCPYEFLFLLVCNSCCRPFAFNLHACMSTLCCITIHKSLGHRPATQLAEHGYLDVYTRKTHLDSFVRFIEFCLHRSKSLLFCR
jgi:hypothetical protein